MTISVKQLQKHHTFKFPIEFGIVTGGEIRIEAVQVNEKTTKFEIELEDSPDKVEIDPEFWLLYQEK